MTVKHANESEDRSSCTELSMEMSNQEIFDRCLSEKLKRFNGGVERDQESGSSAEEDSPKSVVENGLRHQNRRHSKFVHHQVLKIREEDSHIGEDIRDNHNYKFAVIDHLSSSHVGGAALIFSRPILPSSPLSGKTPIRSFQ